MPVDNQSDGNSTIFNGNIKKMSKDLSNKNDADFTQSPNEANESNANNGQIAEQSETPAVTDQVKPAVESNNKKDEAIAAQKEADQKKLSFRDLFFLSFGGQAPFISLLTFGTVMIAMVGTAGAFAMIIATFVVLANGLVVYVMSSKFKKGGGYYTYAFYSLSSNLGLETGWNYLLYSIMYGGALLVGGAFVLYTLTGINQGLLALIVALIASAFVLKGIKVSAKYATIMSVLEIALILILSVFFLSLSNWHFYDPVSFPPLLLVAVIFGLGIPTGYGSIAPLSEDVKNSTHTIGRVAISVLLIGGFVAALFFYSLGSLDFSGNMISFLALKLGLIGFIIIAFVALNDGTLGGMTYMIADSRTFNAMSKDGKFPSIFSLNINNKPILAEVFIVVVFTLTISSSAYFFGLYDTFLAFGALAGLSNLLIHISAGMSLIKISFKRVHKHLRELGVGLTASLVSFIVMIFSIPGINKYIVYLFFGWIILGFLYGEALDMSNNAEED